MTYVGFSSKSSKLASSRPEQRETIDWECGNKFCVPAAAVDGLGRREAADRAAVTPKQLFRKVTAITSIEIFHAASGARQLLGMEHVRYRMFK
jgi:hypothetical protein